MQLTDKIKALSKQKLEEVIAIRRHIHMYPELSFEEEKTAAFVASKLDIIGIPYRDKVAGTGIVAEIKGKNPESKTIVLRSDLDALPITEKNNTEYKSRNVGKMHACGHDVHTSCLLGAASILNELKDQFEGTIKLIFQPGEEKLPGGASLIIKEGILHNPKPDFIIGQHVMPEMEVGKVGFRPGLYMASTDEIYITVKGKGGHGAMPHQNIDAVLITAHLIIALQQVASRWSKPSIPTVLSIGKVIANGATNVIPDEVKLEGTFRTFDEEWRAEAHKRMKEMAESLVNSMGGTVDFEIRNGYPFLKNDERLTNLLSAAAKEYAGKENVEALELRTTAEDFAFYTHVVPGCFYRLGTGNKAKGITAPVHSPEFDVDEKSLETGMGILAFLAITALENTRHTTG
jgi:amidohydrolase